MTTSEIQAYSVCVKECPASSNHFSFQFSPTTNFTSKPEWLYLYDTSPSPFKVCVPTDPTELTMSEFSGYNQTLGANTGLYQLEHGLEKQLQRSIGALLFCSLLTVILNIVYIQFMSKFPETLAKVSVVFINISAVIAVVWLVVMAQQAQPANRFTYYLWAGLSALYALLLDCMIVVRWKQFLIAIAIMDATAGFFANTKRLIIVSLIYFIATLAIHATLLASMFFAVCLNKFQLHDTGFQSYSIKFDTESIVILCFLVFTYLWITFFIHDNVTFITAVSASSYYFSSNKEQIGSARVGLAITWTYTKHVGSLALGSLVQTIVKIIVTTIEMLLENDNSNSNPAESVFNCMAATCCQCMEGLLDYLEKLAFTYMAISGDTFCTSAWNGFLLNYKHCVKFFFALDLAGEFISIGYMFILAINCLVLFVYFEFEGWMNSSMVYIPFIFMLILTLTITKIFLGQFGEATLTTLLCYAVDCDLNNRKPQYGPPSYHEKLDKIFKRNTNAKAGQAGKKPVAAKKKAPAGATALPGGAPAAVAAAPQ